jgi:hypothetical protein
MTRVEGFGLGFTIGLVQSGKERRMAGFYVAKGRRIGVKTPSPRHWFRLKLEYEP